ncbi:sensor histidine kinase [Sphingobium algorifonticola]|uniref:histidine kinase n=1 Tax=Sphingobium algorifonticola TaxID=2008318 RepID=A0A437JC25_9SPHN|nr:ATP-binding protein [Sphingobium algorifonticola]RVT43414.1 PAS domain-containing protein [Sphingobium algorifonticola]
MNRTSPLQNIVSVAVVLAGAAGTYLFGGHWESGVIAGVAGLLALFIMADSAPPPTAATIDQPAGPTAVDLLDHPDFPAVLEGISEPLLIAARGKVVRANRAALRLLGTHIVGEDARIAIRHPAAAERLSSPGPMAEPVSINLVGLGTREQRWEMRIAALPSHDDNAVSGDDKRRIVHLMDRTGSYAAERMRVDFVANASHELRTPLAAILGFIETLADPIAAEDKNTRGRFLKIMDGEARRMQRLVDDLMSLSRIEAEKYRTPDDAIDLRELAAEVVAVFRDSHGPRGQDVVAQIDSAAPPVQGDRAQLSQVLHNLVGNSVKYARPGTPITVSLTGGASGMVRLSVADEGEGIGPDHLPRLTERFYRVDSGRSRAMGGTGLGLAIVKHIVERHRGRMDIASIVGKGTTITILLPVAEEA